MCLLRGTDWIVECKLHLFRRFMFQDSICEHCILPMNPGYSGVTARPPTPPLKTIEISSFTFTDPVITNSCTADRMLNSPAGHAPTHISTRKRIIPPSMSLGVTLQYGWWSFIPPNPKCRLRTNPHNADINYSYTLSGYFRIRNAFSSDSSSRDCNTTQHLPSLSIVILTYLLHGAESFLKS